MDYNIKEKVEELVKTAITGIKLDYLGKCNTAQGDFHLFSLISEDPTFVIDVEIHQDLIDAWGREIREEREKHDDNFITALFG